MFFFLKIKKKKIESDQIASCTDAAAASNRFLFLLKRGSYVFSVAVAAAALWPRRRRTEHEQIVPPHPSLHPLLPPPLRPDGCFDAYPVAPFNPLPPPPPRPDVCFDAYPVYPC